MLAIIGLLKRLVPMSRKKPAKGMKKQLPSANSRALRLLDEVELLSRYLFQLDRKNAESITRRRRGLQTGRISAAEVIAHLKPFKDELLNRSRCTVDLGKLRAELLKTPSDWPGAFIPLWQLEQDFPGFRAIIPTNAPVHALFLVLIRGIYERAGCPEVWVAEAAMYEDMCMAVNELCSLGSLEKHTPVFERKRRTWLVRSVILNSFLFIEAYLNGIGIECLVKRWDSLSKKERTLLAEYNFDKKIESWVNFREKLLKYPRIAVAASHPLLQESNDADVRAFVGEFRELRDSIVHASHRMFERGGGMGLGKVECLLQLTQDNGTALRCTDSAVRLVRKLHESMGRNTRSLSWLLDRDPKTGLFPPKAFE